MNQLTASQKQSYWERVQYALKMAGASNELAESLVHEIEHLPEEQQDLFYHAEPLDVARDLSGIERWSAEQVRDYIETSRTRTNEELVKIPREPGQPGSHKTEWVGTSPRAPETKTTTDDQVQQQPPTTTNDEVAEEQQHTGLGLLASGVFGLVGITIIIALAAIGLISLTSAIILSILTLVVALVLFTFFD
jgi:hypothetical protein